MSPGGVPRHVHVLLVHGVGRHESLSSLLEVYQAIRSNLSSPEAPVPAEDIIPGWTLEEFDLDASPPYVKIAPRYSLPNEPAAVHLYEVNYSHLAGIVRKNHQLDLTRLFVGFDHAVRWARQLMVPPPAPDRYARPMVIAKQLQKVSGVLTAATGPLLGVPALLLRRYTATFIATFTRFFEDVVTFAVDKNGERLISAHLDKTVDKINQRRQEFPGSLVFAAHSLGSVVAHNYIVRHWATEKRPDTIVTFGSPIGVIRWLWLFLDFTALNPDQHRDPPFFCWTKIEKDLEVPAQRLRWLNVVNCLDPIASAITLDAVHLSLAPVEVCRMLEGSRVVNIYGGRTSPLAVMSAHTNYLRDRRGFMEVLLRTVGLRGGDPEDVECCDVEGHWQASWSALSRLRAVVYTGAVAFGAAYLAAVAWHFQSWPLLYWTPLFAFPAVTVGGMAMVQRFFFGGATKRIGRDQMAQLSGIDLVALPYRLRNSLARLADRIDGRPPAGEPPAYRQWIGRAAKFLAFIPTAAAMAVPWAIAMSVHGDPVRTLPLPAFSYLALLLSFIAYLMACAIFELLTAWQRVLKELGIVPGHR